MPQKNMPNIHDADQVRYDALVSIIDSIKTEADLDSDIYATAIQNLYWPEINVLRQNQIDDDRMTEPGRYIPPQAVQDMFENDEKTE